MHISLKVALHNATMATAHLVDPLQQSSTSFGGDAVAVEGVLVTLRCLHVREDVSCRRE